MAENTPGSTRKVVADHLYLDRGPKEASSRCDANTQFAAVDLCDEMLKHLQLQPGQKMVDVGCGSGQHLVRFTEAVGSEGSAHGYDFSPKAVENTRKRGMPADVADGANLPLENESVDALSSSFSMYYLPDVNATLTEWHRVVRPGGRVVISGPADDTNKELYEFHQAIVGVGPADTDLMALGFVQALPEPAAKAGFQECKVETFTNPIQFPTDEAFLDYWMNTSIFARTVEDDKRDEIRAKGKAHLADKSAPFVITKRVAVAICIR